MSKAKKKSLLIVDDEQAIRETLTAMLNESNYTVHTAANAGQALERIESCKPPVILLDIYMPGRSGLDLLQQIKKKYPDQIIIIISGAGSRDDAVKALRYGAFDYLTKPIIAISVLLQTVKRGIDHYNLIKENKNYKKNLEKIVKNKTRALRQKERQTNRLNRVLKLIHWISKSYNHFTSPEQLLNALYTSLGKEKIFRYINIYLLDQNKKIYKSAGSKKYSAGSKAAQLNPPCVQHFLQSENNSKIVINKNNCRQCPFYTKQHSGQTAMIPVNYNNNIVGMICLTGKKTVSFNTAMVEALANLGNEIGLKLHTISIKKNMRAAKNELDRSKQQYLNLTEVLPEIVFETDANMNISFLNRHGRDLFYKTANRHETKSFNLLDFMPSEERSKAKYNLQKRLKGRAQGAASYSLCLPGNKHMPVLMHAEPTMIDSRCTGWRGVIINNTKQNNKIVKQKKEIRFQQMSNRIYQIIRQNKPHNFWYRLKLAVDLMCEQLPAQRLSIMLPDDNNHLRIVTENGLWPETCRQVNNRKTATPVADYVFQKGIPVIINNQKELEKFVRSHPDFKFFRFKRQSRNRMSILPLAIIPAETNKKNLGVINISGKNYFSDEDKELIHKISKLLAEEIKDELHNAALQKVNEEKQIKEKMLIRAQRLSTLGELTSAIAHEVRQPLNVIKIIATGLQIAAKRNQTLSCAANRENLQKIVKGTDKINRIVQSIYSIGKKPQKITVKELNLNHSVKEIISFYNQKLKYHSIKLELKLKPDIKNILIS
ncbi:MAG TPA: response regulator, partial [Spirochaetota bacterium]|nr:response regulator [Spirochaetota bacterium]